MNIKVIGQYQPPSWVDVGKYWERIVQGSKASGMKVYDCERYFFVGTSSKNEVLVQAGRYKHFVAARLQWDIHHPVPWAEFVRTVPIVGVAATIITSDNKVLLGKRARSMEDTGIYHIVPAGGVNGCHRVDDEVNARAAVVDECRTEIFKYPGYSGLCLSEETFQFLKVIRSLEGHCWNPTVTFYAKLFLSSEELRAGKEHAFFLYLDREGYEHRSVTLPRATQQSIELAWRRHEEG